MLETEMLTYEHFVKLPGVVDIKWLSDDPEFCCRTEDLFEVQSRGIPDAASFGKKDKATTIQAVFVCNTCDCELKSVVTLRAHTKGLQHMKNECAKLHQMTLQKSSNRKHEDERPEVSLDDLEKVLQAQEDEVPVIGIMFLEEVREVNGGAPIYRCKLCRDFTADSRVILRHLTQLSHQASYFKRLYSDAPRTRDDLIENVKVEYSNLGGPQLDKMLRTVDPRLYAQIVGNRSDHIFGEVPRSGLRKTEDGASRLPFVLAGMKRRIDESIVEKVELGAEEGVLPNSPDLEDSKIARSTKLQETLKEETACQDRILTQTVKQEDQDLKDPTVIKEESAPTGSNQARSSPDDLSSLPSLDASSSEEKADRKLKLSILAFHADIADWVKKCLNLYYFENSPFGKRIASAEEYGNLAKDFSRQFREEEKLSYVARGEDLGELRISDLMKDRIKREIDTHFEK